MRELTRLTIESWATLARTLPTDCPWRDRDRVERLLGDRDHFTVADVLSAPMILPEDRIWAAAAWLPDEVAHRVLVDWSRQAAQMLPEPRQALEAVAEQEATIPGPMKAAIEAAREIQVPDPPATWDYGSERDRMAIYLVRWPDWFGWDYASALRTAGNCLECVTAYHAASQIKLDGLVGEMDRGRAVHSTAAVCRDYQVTSVRSALRDWTEEAT